MKNKLNQVKESTDKVHSDDEVSKLVTLYNELKVSLLKAERNWFLKLIARELYDYRIQSYRTVLKCTQNKLNSRGVVCD